jgi:hypothetical protein
MKYFILIGFFFFILSLFRSFQALGQVKEMNTRELVEESTTILIGTCVETQSYWNEKQDKIFTDFRLQADRYVKGDLGSEAVITIPGGQVGQMRYEVSDMPFFQEGEEVLVFIWRHSSGKDLVTGGLHGKLTVVEDEQTGEKYLRGAHWQPQQKERKSKENTNSKAPTLDQFIQEVEKYLTN